MHFSHSLRVALVAVTGALVLSTAVHAQTSLRAIAAWSPTLTQVKDLFYKFEENVTKASNGEIKFQNSGPETVPAFEQFQPLSAGAFDFMYGASSYHQAQTGVALAMELLGDMSAVRKAGVLDAINDYYRKKFGVEVLAIIRTPANQFVLKEPIDPGAALKGRKIRSNPLYDSAIKSLGAVPVSMSPADAYAAMQKGTLDGIAFPMHAVADFKLYEVGKYMTLPPFGTAVDVLMVNAKKIDSLPKEQQKIIRDEAQKLESTGAARMVALADEQQKTMLEHGVKVTEFSPETAKAAEQSFNEGVIEIARKSDPAGVDALLNLARSKGVMRK